MTVYSDLQAGQRLAAVLDEAERSGSVRIRRQDGREFDLVPVRASPFDVEGAGLDLTADEIVAAVRDARNRP